MKLDKTKIAVEIFNKLATLYQDKFMDVNLYGDTLNLFCNAIDKQHPEILELACGPGNITKFLLEKRPDFKILGTDLAPNMIALAKTNNPNAEFKIMDCRAIALIDKKYDAIMCGFCLPYLSKEETLKLITDASKCLTQNGIFYISTMEEDYNNSGFTKGSTGDEIFMHYYLEKDITSVLQKNNFEILDLSRVDSSNQNTKDLIIIAKHHG